MPHPGRSEVIRSDLDLVECRVRKPNAIPAIMSERGRGSLAMFVRPDIPDGPHAVSERRTLLLAPPLDHRAPRNPRVRPPNITRKYSVPMIALPGCKRRRSTKLASALRVSKSRSPLRKRLADKTSAQASGIFAATQKTSQRIIHRRRDPFRPMRFRSAQSEPVCRHQPRAQRMKSGSGRLRMYIATRMASCELEMYRAASERMRLSGKTRLENVFETCYDVVSGLRSMF